MVALRPSAAWQKKALPPAPLRRPMRRRAITGSVDRLYPAPWNSPHSPELLYEARRVAESYGFSGISVRRLRIAGKGLFDINGYLRSFKEDQVRYSHWQSEVMHRISMEGLALSRFDSVALHHDVETLMGMLASGRRQ